MLKTGNSSGKKYLLAVNLKHQPLTVQFSFPGGVTGAYSKFSQQSLPTNQGVFVDNIEGLGVRLYELSYDTSPFCTVQGRVVGSDGTPCNGTTGPATVLMILDNTYPLEANPYAFPNLNAGDYELSFRTPTGYDSSHSTCINCIDHPDSSYVAGDTITFNCPGGGYYDLYWKLTPQQVLPDTDLNDDSTVNIFDYNLYVEYALSNQGELIDFNGNGQIDTSDYSMLLSVMTNSI